MYALFKSELPKWLSGKEFSCQCRRCGFNPQIRKIPWRRKWQPTAVFLHGKSHGQRILEGYSPWDFKRVRIAWFMHYENRKYEYYIP